MQTPFLVHSLNGTASLFILHYGWVPRKLYTTILCLEVSVASRKATLGKYENYKVETQGRDILDVPLFDTKHSFGGKVK